MKIITYIFLLVCFVVCNGCCCCCPCPCTKQNPVDVVTTEEKTIPIVKIQDPTLTQTYETLTLEYTVSNPFTEAIWVCHDTDIHPNDNIQNVVRRTDGETLWIRLGANPNINLSVIADPASISKYCRLLPGESCSGKIVFDLPLRNISIVSDLKTDREQIIVNRVVLEVGYLGCIFNKFFDYVRKQMKEDKIDPKPLKMDESYYLLPYSPLISEERQDGQSREVVYINSESPTLLKEEYAEAVFPYVDIPVLYNK